MKKMHLFKLLIIVLAIQLVPRGTNAQTVSAMPTFTGITIGSYVPIIIPVSGTWANRKYSLDSLAKASALNTAISNINTSITNVNAPLTNNFALGGTFSFPANGWHENFVFLSTVNQSIMVTIDGGTPVEVELIANTDYKLGYAVHKLTPFNVTITGATAPINLKIYK